MDIYVPKYYKNFVCIADKCAHSCCIDWEIDVDRETYLKYKSLEGEYAKEIVKNIEKDGDTYYFALGKNNRCPNLDINGLCKIITNLGEEYLCDICRLHPRFFNEAYGRKEVGLGFSCEEAVRVALLSEEPFELEKIGEDESNPVNKNTYVASDERDRLIAAFEDNGIPLSEKIEAIEREYSLDKVNTVGEEWLDILLSLEILDCEWKNILEGAKNEREEVSLSKYEKYLTRFMQYLLYRHISLAVSELNFRARLGFCLLGLNIITYIAKREKNLTRDKLFDIIRLYSSEIEYSEENTEELIFEFESVI